MLKLDHLVVAAETLEAGCAWVEGLLGINLGPIGHHPDMGTHNRLLSLGPDLYFEVIAVDPEAEGPGRPRWYDLDRFEGVPRLQNWAVRTDVLDKARAAAPDGTGDVMQLQRADFRWRMVVPPSGLLPFDGAYPALIQWDSGDPAPLLPDQGVRLKRLDVIHPEAPQLAGRLAPQLNDPRVRFAKGVQKALKATFETSSGEVELA